MQTQVGKKRKNIDIPDDVFRTLSMMAAADGKNLKNYIEDMLVEKVTELSDEDLYRYLLATDKEGQEYLSEKEQQEFEKWLGV